MNIKRAKLPVIYKSSKEINMFDITKFKFDAPEFNQLVQKSTSVALQTLDFNQAIFAESLKYFNQITDKMFYTYTVNAADAVNKTTEYAKENIAKAEVATIFGTGK